MCDQDWESFIGHTSKFLCLRTEIFCVKVHGMACALEINSNGGYKKGHVESYPPTTNNIISPLPQFLRPPNLTDW